MLRKTFQALDTDHSLSLNYEKLLKSVGSAPAAASMMRSMDKNRDGKIDFLEFCEGFEKAQQLTGTIEEEEVQRSPEEVARLRKARGDENNALLLSIFAFCDVDGSESISATEVCMSLKYFLGRSVTAEEKLKVQTVFHGRQAITFEQFKADVVPWMLSYGVVLKLPPQKLSRSIFDFVDADSSGFVSAAEATMGLRFLGVQATDKCKAVIESLPCFACGSSDVDFRTFEKDVLPTLMALSKVGTEEQSTRSEAEELKAAKDVEEKVKAVIADSSFSAEDKVARIKQLYEKKSKWLEQIGAYELVDGEATALVTDFTAK